MHSRFTLRLAEVIVERKAKDGIVATREHVDRICAELSDEDKQELLDTIKQVKAGLK